MHGMNPKRPPETGDGQMLQVVEIFPTLQGEGPFAGQSAVFVRLGGCNLTCDFCDTEFERFAPMPLATLVDEVQRLASGDGQRVRDLVVITGGEPFRQPIGPLCDALLEHGFRVQIETNGTLYRPVHEEVTIICSPKVTDGRYHPIRPDLLARVDAMKFIVSAEAGDYHNVAEVGQATYRIPVYVQPMDVGDAARNAANTAHALQIAQQQGYRLSLQLHKMLGIA